MQMTSALKELKLFAHFQFPKPQNIYASFSVSLTLTGNLFQTWRKSFVLWQTYMVKKNELRHKLSDTDLLALILAKKKLVNVNKLTFPNHEAELSLEVNTSSLAISAVFQQRSAGYPYFSFQKNYRKLQPDTVCSDKN